MVLSGECRRSPSTGSSRRAGISQDSYISGMFEPMTYTLGGASSDMMHRQAFLDGRRETHVAGRRGTASLGCCSWSTDAG